MGWVRDGKSWAWAIVAVLPYLAVYAAHPSIGAPGSTPTWFVQYDQPYYAANGRAIFERGNGFLGPNPYDPRPEAPSIYFQWLPWMLGALVHGLGVDPGLAYMAVGVVAAIAVGRLTMALVAHFVGDERARIVLTLTAMWGGGVAVLLARVDDLRRPQPLGILRFEPFDGWWMFCWGRNVVLSTEAVYHALMAGAWLAALAGRWTACLACVALLAATHPFSGAQALAIFAAYAIVGRLAPAEERCPPWFVAGLVLIGSTFAGYYFAYLPRFAEHRALQADWSIGWVEEWLQTCAAYASIAALAMARVALDGRKLGTGVHFLASCSAVSFALAHHDILIPARQPLHFNRGYVWFPLFLIACPMLSRAITRLARSIPGWTLLILLALVGCLDNIVWLNESLHGRIEHGHSLPAGARAALDELDRSGESRVVLCGDDNLSYLIATYTRCRPYYGHSHNTPDYAMRKEQAQGFFRDGRIAGWFAAVDLVLAEVDRPVPDEIRRTWQVAYRNRSWTIYERPRPGHP